MESTPLIESLARLILRWLCFSTAAVTPSISGQSSDMVLLQKRRFISGFFSGG